MLHYLGEMHWSPHVAVITLLSQDHLEWHGSYDAYADAKRNIARFQRPDDVTVVNEESPAALELARASAGAWRAMEWMGGVLSNCRCRAGITSSMPKARSPPRRCWG